MNPMGHRCALFQALILALLLSLNSFSQTTHTAQRTGKTAAEPQAFTLPTEDEINSVVTQAERAFLIYENTLGGSDASTPNDQKLITDAKEVIKHIKKNPQYFNAPMGFLLVTDLDDASRDLALCAFQEGVTANIGVTLGRADDAALQAATSKIHAAQSFMDASALLQTVGETAFNLYMRYLAANFQAQQEQAQGLQECLDTLQKCANVLKKH